MSAQLVKLRLQRVPSSTKSSQSQGSSKSRCSFTVSPEELFFEEGSSVVQILRITNFSNVRLAYKLEPLSPWAFDLFPASGLLERREQTSIRVEYLCSRRLHNEPEQGEEYIQVLVIPVPTTLEGEDLLKLPLLFDVAKQRASPTFTVRCFIHDLRCRPMGCAHVDVTPAGSDSHPTTTSTSHNSDDAVTAHTGSSTTTTTTPPNTPTTATMTTVKPPTSAAATIRANGIAYTTTTTTSVANTLHPTTSPSMASTTTTARLRSSAPVLPLAQSGTESTTTPLEPPIRGVCRAVLSLRFCFKDLLLAALVCFILGHLSRGPVLPPQP